MSHTRLGGTRRVSRSSERVSFRDLRWRASSTGSGWPVERSSITSSQMPPLRDLAGQTGATTLISKNPIETFFRHPVSDAPDRNLLIVVRWIHILRFVRCTDWNRSSRLGPISGLRDAASHALVEHRLRAVLGLMLVESIRGASAPWKRGRRIAMARWCADRRPFDRPDLAPPVMDTMIARWTNPLPTEPVFIDCTESISGQAPFNGSWHGSGCW